VLLLVLEARWLPQSVLLPQAVLAAMLPQAVLVVVVPRAVVVSSVLVLLVLRLLALPLVVAVSSVLVLPVLQLLALPMVVVVVAVLLVLPPLLVLVFLRPLRFAACVGRPARRLTQHQSRRASSSSPEKRLREYHQGHQHQHQQSHLQELPQERRDRRSAPHQQQQH
jgi:hypothetical protein